MTSKTKKSRTSFDSFASKLDGLYYTNRVGRRELVCPKILVYATATVEGTDNWVSIVKFVDRSRKVQKMVVPMSDLKSRSILKELADRGFYVPYQKEKEDMLLQYLSTANPSRHLTILRRTGWIDKHFVFPEMIIGPKADAFIYQKPEVIELANFGTSGTLRGWKRHIATPSVASSRMVFAISLAAAALLLRLCAVENGCIHIVGPSSRGKTTLLVAAASFFGKATPKDLMTWDFTTSGLEDAAVSYCDMLLCIDDIGHLDGTDVDAAKMVRKVAYQLAGGRGRQRAVSYQTGLHSQMWHLLTLSSGEIGISDIAHLGHRKRHKGEEVRLIDLPAIVDDTLGIYEALPDGYDSPAKLSEDIVHACQQHHGVAARTYVKNLIANNDDAKAKIEAWMAEFQANVDVPLNGWERRFASRFALAYAAAMLGAEFRIFPWSQEVIFDSIAACYRDARTMLPDTPELLQPHLKKLQRLLRRDKHIEKVTKSASLSGSEYEQAKVFLLEDETSEGLFAVKPRAFTRWLGDRGTAIFVLKRLKSLGYLDCRENRPSMTVQKRISGLSARRGYYCIRKTFLDWTGE